MNTTATNLELFGDFGTAAGGGEAAPDSDKAEALGQYFTPHWAAVELYRAYFNHLTNRDLVAEIACGDGAMLGAIPEHVPAFGVEIDPSHARVAQAVTGRQVIVGDFLKVPLPPGITAVFSNPPFSNGFVEPALERARGFLPEGGKMGLILPSYMFQTSSTVVRWSQHWIVQQEALPRDLFPAGRVAGVDAEGRGSGLLSKPISFVLFTKDRNPQLIGFRLYRQTREIRDLPENYQRMLVHCGANSRSVWRHAVRQALKACGGRATLETIYDCMSGNRPTGSARWKFKVRQTLNRYTRDFSRVAKAEYALAA